MPSIPCPLSAEEEGQHAAAVKEAATSSDAAATVTATAAHGFQLVHPPAGAPASALDDTYLKSLLSKWDLRRHASLLSLHYPHKHYHKMQGAALAADLFNDPEFQAAFQVAVKDGRLPLGGAVTHVELETVPATTVR